MENAVNFHKKYMYVDICGSTVLVIYLPHWVK